MKIKLHEITIGEIYNGYADSGENGVVGYGGKLNIRPKYQREFVYDDKKRNAVIDTINRGFPLNVMYWAVNEDGTYEILDGQQRTVSFCRYVHGDFSIDNRYFHNLTQTEKDVILNYKTLIYFCEGTDKEKLEWFRIINIAGEKLTEQELRNATYTGPWLTSAKSMFSRNNGAGYNALKNYVGGSLIRQEILETAIKWKSKGHIEDYMAQHQHDHDANELFNYIQSVAEWIKDTFKKDRPKMKEVNWGELYDLYHEKTYDTEKLEKRISALFMDDDVTNKSGIYKYVLSGEEKYLNIRAFTERQKLAAYEKQQGICPYCKNEGKDAHYDITEMEADHIKPWREGGRTSDDNCQMLCKYHNRIKGGR